MPLLDTYEDMSGEVLFAIIKEVPALAVVGDGLEVDRSAEVWESHWLVHPVEPQVALVPLTLHCIACTASAQRSKRVPATWFGKSMTGRRQEENRDHEYLG